jgi:CheY-like chemotaxis protein
MLGDENGAVLIDRYQQAGLLENVPIIFFSALVKEADVKPAQRGHKVAMLEKSIGVNELVKQIEILIHNQ